MINAGIHDGDLLVVDRSVEATDGKVVIVSLNGELTVKRFHQPKANPGFCPKTPTTPHFLERRRRNASLGSGHERIHPAIAWPIAIIFTYRANAFFALRLMDGL